MRTLYDMHDNPLSSYDGREAFDLAKIDGRNIMQEKYQLFMEWRFYDAEKRFFLIDRFGRRYAYIR